VISLRKKKGMEKQIIKNRLLMMSYALLRSDYSISKVEISLVLVRSMEKGLKAIKL